MCFLSGPQLIYNPYTLLVTSFQYPNQLTHAAYLRRKKEKYVDSANLWGRVEVHFVLVHAILSDIKVLHVCSTSTGKFMANPRD